MTGDYVFYVFPKDWKSNGSEPPMAEVISGEQKMLDRVVALTKIKAKFSVFKVGECVGDFS